MLEKDGKFLLVREASGTDKDKWNHPAGWLDPGEHPVEAAKREVLEESGYEIEPTHLLGIYSLVRKDSESKVGVLPHGVKLIFKGKILNETPYALTDEITETKWFSPEEIYVMDGNTLRDEDIKQMVRDYLAGKELPLGAVIHTIQDN
jgi:8-oxo-dGTP pyrophosphatase MutT (NUDIX family)